MAQDFCIKERVKLYIATSMRGFTVIFFKVLTNKLQHERSTADVYFGNKVNFATGRGKKAT